jgi:predicted deacylase
LELSAHREELFAVPSPISCSIDLEGHGKASGVLRIPRSSNEAGWASSYVPIVRVSNGDGPTVLVTGGNHGDEYVGEVTALKLARDLQPELVTGRVIIVPVISVEASQAGTRLWPNGSNFNRCFPGDPCGEPAYQLAHYFTTELLPRCEALIDIHSGGRSMQFLPVSHMHVVEDIHQRRLMLEAMLMWNTDYHFLYITDIAGGGLFPVEATNQGKIVVTTELGGGGYVPARVQALATRGLYNTLRHLGVLSGKIETRASLGLPEATILDGRDLAGYIYAPDHGLFEAMVDPGDVVQAGQPVGQVHFVEHPDREPSVLVARISGIVVCMRAIANTTEGDVVCVIGVPIEKGAVLSAEVN